MANKKSYKFSDEDIIKAYQYHKNVWDAGKAVGASGQTISRRLKALNIKTQSRPYSQSEINAIKITYAGAIERGDVDLKNLAKSLGRPYHSVCAKAGKLGLTSATRPLKKETAEILRSGVLRMNQEGRHPRGALGMKHTDDARKIISQKSQSSWDCLSARERSKRSLLMMKGKDAAGGQNQGRSRGSWYSCWLEIGGKKHFFRSKWEINYAMWLEFRKITLGEILDWEYEPETFWFEKILRGVRSYKPDFRITLHDGTQYFDEVKGWMDEQSKTKLNRMRIYHPKVKVNVIGAQWFKANKSLSAIVPGWIT